MIDTARTRPRYINATNGSKFQLEERSLNTEYLVVVKKSEKRVYYFTVFLLMRKNYQKDLFVFP